MVLDPCLGVEILVFFEGDLIEALDVSQSQKENFLLRDLFGLNRRNSP